MRSMICLLAAVAVLGCSVAVSADEPGDRHVVTPLNGRDLSNWKYKGSKERSHWTIGAAKIDPDNAARLVVSKDVPAGESPQLINAQGGGVDIYTEQQFGDQIIELELMVPKGSNSGVYVMGEYEVQVLDSYGKEQVGPGDVGGLYGAAAPRTNASRPPGQWQTLRIEFRAPRFDGDKKTANALFKKVVLNSTTIHENVEMKGPTPSGVTGKESAQGPLMFQGDHGAVAFRNIKITAPKGQ